MDVAFTFESSVELEHKPFKQLPSELHLVK